MAKATLVKKLKVFCARASTLYMTGRFRAGGEALDGVALLGESRCRLQRSHGGSPIARETSFSFVVDVAASLLRPHFRYLCRGESRSNK